MRRSVLGHGHSVGWRRAIELVGVVALFAGSLLGSATASRAVLPQAGAFTCATLTVFVSQGDPATRLYQETSSSSGATFAPIGPAWTGNGHTTLYNALAFNPADGYLYAIASSQSGAVNGYDLLRIDSSGTVDDLGHLSGMPTDSRYINNGAFFNGVYYVAAYLSTELFAVNLSSRSVQVTTLSQSWTPADFTQVGSDLWGVDGSLFGRLDPATGQVMYFENSVTSAGDGAGGVVFTTPTGALGVSSTDTGVVSQIAIGASAGAHPSFTVLSQVSGPTSTRNDGAACQPAPAPVGTDLSVTIAGPVGVAAGGSLSWAVTVANHGPSDSSGFTVTAVLPSSLSSVRGSGGVCTRSGRNLTCVGAPLAAGGSRTITVAGTAPSSGGTCLSAAVQVAANESDPVTSNNSARSGQTCTTALSGRVIVTSSTSPATVTKAGQRVTYTVRVKNGGSAGLSSVSVAQTDFTGAGPAPRVTCPVAVLAPGASTTCTATYAVTQADVDEGGVMSEIVASGVAAGAVTTKVSAHAAATVSADVRPGVSVTRSASGTTAPGGTTTWRYQVVNTGNVTLSGLTVRGGDPTDRVGSAEATCPTQFLAPGQSLTCTGR